jgi:hypothetical protein
MWREWFGRLPILHKVGLGLGIAAPVGLTTMGLIAVNTGYGADSTPQAPESAGSTLVEITLLIAFMGIYGLLTYLAVTRLPAAYGISIVPAAGLTWAISMPVADKLAFVPLYALIMTPVLWLVASWLGYRISNRPYL